MVHLSPALLRVPAVRAIYRRALRRSALCAACPQYIRSRSRRPGSTSPQARSIKCSTYGRAHPPANYTPTSPACQPDRIRHHPFLCTSLRGCVRNAHLLRREAPRGACAWHRPEIPPAPGQHRSVKDGKLIKTFKGEGGIFEVCWNSRGDKVKPKPARSGR